MHASANQEQPKSNVDSLPQNAVSQRLRREQSRRRLQAGWGTAASGRSSLLVVRDDVGASAAGAEDDVELAAFGDDEGAVLVVVGVGIGVGTDLLSYFGVVIGPAVALTAVGASAAVLGSRVLRTSRVARVIGWSLDVVVRVGIYAIARRLRRIDLEVPRAPLSDLRTGDFAVKVKRVGGVGAEELLIVVVGVEVRSSKVSNAANARRVGACGIEILQFLDSIGQQYDCHW